MRTRKKTRHAGGRPLRDAILVAALKVAGVETLADLAERAGYAPSTLRALRTDPARVPPAMRDRIAGVLKIPPAAVAYVVFPGDSR